MTILREAQKAVQIVKTKERGDDKEYWEGAENEVVGREKGREEGRAGQRQLSSSTIYFCITSPITYFTLYKVITFKVALTVFYFIINRNKSKMMSGVAMDCSDQHSRFR